MIPDRAIQSTLILLGGTGDLATRKLLPALFELWRENKLDRCVVLAVGRRCENQQEYWQMLTERVKPSPEQMPQWDQFLQIVAYHRGDINTTSDFEELKQSIEAVEKERNLPGKRLFYYALGPKFFAPVTDRLAEVGLLTRRDPVSNNSAPHIVVEKPFGHDLQSARELNKSLLSHIDEEQIFRIDHYLGKETVQNVLAVRFGNGMFEPLWNHKYIASVQITVAESLGLEGRAGYYNGVGALRDMVQNHMLQLLAVTAMEPPISLEPEAIRDEKTKVLRSIRIPSGPEEVHLSTVRGQYGPGRVDGKEVRGYREEEGVPPDSQTPTYVAARLYLDSWRWANVPFLLRHGKRMNKRGTEIAIHFTTPPLALFRGTHVCETAASMLVLRIQPNEGISLNFGAKKPGPGMEIANVSMDFDYDRAFNHKVADSYKRLLLDALVGDPTLFLRADEVVASWRWADAILDGWDRLPPEKFPNYAAGGWGPPEAESLFPQADHIPAGACPVGWRRW